LQPNTTYTLSATLNYGTTLYESSVTMQSDASGAIDTSTTPALSGSYTGADYDGLFWSMTTSSPDAKVSAVAAPAYQISVSLNGTQVQLATLPQGLLQPGVHSVALTGTGLVGLLYIPNAPGPRPAIITYGGSEGGVYTGEMNGVALANAGYVALGIGYFGATGVPKDLANIPLEYFQKAIQYLQSRPEVQGDKIAVMGMSRGGELSLLLGATFPQIKAVVAMVPSPYLWGANDATAESSTPNPAWTLNGVGLPFLNSDVDPAACVTMPNGKKAYCDRPIFEGGVSESTPTQLESASSKIEQTNGPILLLGGEADEMWQSCPFSDIAMARLKAKNHAFADEEVCYPNAGHMGVGIPGAPTTDTNIVWDAPDYLDLGGTAAGNAAAQRNAWNKILEFLNTNLNGSGT
jgi:dienelactone hydrolase